MVNWATDAWSVLARSVVVVAQEPPTGLQLCQEALRLLGPLVRGSRAHDDGRQQDGRGKVGDRVDPEGQRECRHQGRDEQSRQRVRDDVADRLPDPHRRVGGHELVPLDQLRHDRHSCGSKEDRDGRHDEDQRIDEEDVHGCRDRDEQDDRRTQDVADDEDLLAVPSVDERARDRREEQVRQGRRHERECCQDFGAGRRQDHSRQRELMDPVAEHRDELARPQRRERPVEREPDIRMAPEQLHDLGSLAGDGDGGR